LHDAHIAALLIEHGVYEIVTADEAFRRFRRLKMTNPFRPFYLRREWVTLLGSSLVGSCLRRFHPRLPIVSSSRATYWTPV
jgi:hypothetical protein